MSKPRKDPGTYYLESTLQPPVFYYSRPAVGQERFTEKTLQFFREHRINPNNPKHVPEAAWVTYRISPSQRWQDQNGIVHTGFCNCQGFQVRKKCRHLDTARQLAKSLTNSNHLNPAA